LTKHINSALLALSPFERHDVLRKTAPRGRRSTAAAAPQRARSTFIDEFVVRRSTISHAPPALFCQAVSAVETGE
jgi:hypothetical protein